MRPYTRCCQLAFVGMAFAICGYAQSLPAIKLPAPDDKTVAELPVRQVIFTAGEPVSGLATSPVIVLPIQCTGDGALFFEMLQPPSFMQHAIYAVKPKSSRSFDLSAMADLHEVEMITFYPSKDHVSVLVRATKATGPALGEAKVRQSNYGFFVAVFDRNGNYEKSVELALHNVVPSHIAVLSSGDYLVTGYDRTNDMPRLYLVGGDGQVMRPLSLPDNLARYTPSDDPNSAKGLMNSSRVLGSILMTAHGGEVLVWRRGGMSPLLSVGANGSTREVQLEVPHGLTLADVLPSDQMWVAHLQAAASQASGEQNTRPTSYYEFDPSDGRLTSRFSVRGDSPEHVPAVLACEEGGMFLSYQADEKGHTRILSAK